MSADNPDLKIMPILPATGRGSTALAAFHAALSAVHCGHYNLVRLSSVVPLGTRVDVNRGTPALGGDWGDRLYCVYAEQRATAPGDEAWAGIGWVERLDTRGGGLLVEHEGNDEATVTKSIVDSLMDMVRGSRDEYTEPKYVVNGALCQDEPVCSLVIAPFAVVPWETA